jgi:15-cis-phytoene synthase
VSTSGAAAPQPGSARYFCWLYSPKASRARLACLFALEHELLLSVRAQFEHEVAHARLGWWQQELARLAQEAPQHPLTRQLLHHAKAAGSAPPELQALLDAARWDLAATAAASRAELAPRFTQWGESLFRAVLEAVCAGEAPAPAFAAPAGAALAELEALEHLARDARAGRLRLPLDEIDAAGCVPASLATPPWPQGLATMLAARHRQLRASLARGCQALAPPQQARLCGVLAWCALSAAQSLRVERALPERYRARRSECLRDAFGAWRSARRASLGRLALTAEEPAR